MFLTKIKAIVLVFATAGVAAGLALGAAWAPKIGDADEPKQANAETKPLEPEEEKSDWPIARGIVVDEEGLPVAGAAVEAVAGTLVHKSGVTDAEGRFALEMRWPTLWDQLVLAKVDDGRRIGFGIYPSQAQALEGPGDLRIVLGPSREVVVQVTDGAGEPIAGAIVNALELRSTVWETTGPDGRAVLRLPPEALVNGLSAFKSGTGFDYFDNTHERRGQLAEKLPDEIALVLKDPRTVRVRALDSAGQPIAGAKVHPSFIYLPGKEGNANTSGCRFVLETTGQDGFATFDWIPQELTLVDFWVSADGYHAPERTVLRAEDRGETTIVSEQLRQGIIRGRVTFPDGSPAAGIRIEARGKGSGNNNSSPLHCHAKADGTYELAADPTQAYIVAVADDDWAAPSHIGVIVREEGEEIEGIDFALGKGAIIEGTLTHGPSRTPIPEEMILLYQKSGRLPEELGGDGKAAQIWYWRRTYTDSQGHYKFRVGPGTHELRRPLKSLSREIKAMEGGHHVSNFHTPNL